MLCFVMLASCGKNSCDIEGGYEFIIPAQITPTIDTYKVGDTIHFISEFDDMVREKNTGQSYKLENFNFYPHSSVRKIDEYPTISALDNFTLIMDSVYSYNIQRFSNGDVLLYGRYSYNEGLYRLKFEMIPNVTGLYWFSHNSSLIHDYGGEQDFEGKCKNESIREILVYVNEGDHNNLSLLSHGSDTTFNNRILKDPQEKFYEEGVYVFYVVE